VSSSAAVKELFHSFPSITVPPVRPTLAQTTRQPSSENIRPTFHLRIPPETLPLSAWCRRGLRKGAWWKIQKAINGWSRAVVEEDVNDDAEA
jgi:hypothetical protein